MMEALIVSQDCNMQKPLLLLSHLVKLKNYILHVRDSWIIVSPQRGVFSDVFCCWRRSIACFLFGIFGDSVQIRLRQRWRRGTAGGASAELGQISVKNNKDCGFFSSFCLYP